ncbi:MAG: DUF2007 domain-containing protein [Muribaculaceae bacterium]|nr:DUF2007 domain-containing protein [Muribaculaceae bacterium]
MDENDLIIVATFDFDWQAHMAQGLLAEQEIPSTLDNEIFASLYPIGFNTIGGINLRVFRRDADRARDIISKSQL